ncbi:NAD(P) transhydrogenase subunit alpha [Enterovirga sp.]|jgi:NAD(P) transhydrogenase subunit alpha|uniref:NAD(P) transhydrogenase subunit alpha n=1 Tax=Enterovirga sp. TaxID=2026350 RepID=UPI00261D2A01|nr:NAD(P) transhydrogenase subunit alpha [Enterovirga sp.]MDB5590807.1 synthetase [Enterovirga sp.]
MAMTNDQALEAAKHSAGQARAAAEATQSYLDQIAPGLAQAASAATGGHVDPVVFELAVFVMAVFVGYYVVWSVTPALHTPLMSVTNAISSVIVVGGLLSAGVAVGPGLQGHGWARAFGFLAVIMAAINIFGGFLVTNRMLAMYKKKG